jgi:CheY-like chemotaxis protein
MSANSDTAHILVVDDESAIRYSITKTLQRVGYQVDSAASG